VDVQGVALGLLTIVYVLLGVGVVVAIWLTRR
jgi:hypothetical protein